ncbi:MAG: hypothetical protein ACRDJW_06550 [Thermomicrobiales bacterium]
MVDRRAVAGLAILSAMTVGLLAAPTRAQGQPGTLEPPPALPTVVCAVEPSSVDELAALDASATPLPDDAYPPIFIRELPSGTPADAETSDAVTQVVLELVACARADDALRWYALLTDDFVRDIAATTAAPLVAEVLATPAHSPAEQDLRVEAIEQVTLLPDGRVSAVVTLGGVEDAHPAPGRTVLWIFAQQDGRWLLDGSYERVWSGDANVYPVYIADVVATPNHATPTPRP